MIQQKFFKLTNAQILALPTTPIELLAAPGADYRWRLHGATIYVDVTNTIYANINTTYSALQIVYDNGSGYWPGVPIVNDSTTTPPLTSLTTFLAVSTHDAIFDMPVPYSEILGDQWLALPNTFGASAVNGVNKNVVISIDNNGSGNLTGGHSSQVMKVRIYYTKEYIF